MKGNKEFIKLPLVVFAVCIIYRLNIICIGICLGVATYVGGVFLKEEEKRKKYLNKLNDIVRYMEQMIYSFKKQPKIRAALMDAQKIGSDEMKEILEEAIVSIDSGESEQIYEDSLEIIQEEYDCKRLRSLHEFLIKIERHGGEYINYINILLGDVKEWSDRTLLFMKDVERVKRNVVISIVATLITCGFMSYLIPKDYQYTGYLLYQLSTTAMIILMLWIYLHIHRKLNMDWLAEQSHLSQNLIVKYYVLAEKGYQKEQSLNIWERLSYKQAKRRLENEIVKAFPDWIRDVAINLQNTTVQSAIEESYQNAAFVLKRPIRKLLIDFEKYPIGIEPYENFLKEFELPEMKSSIKMFYSMNEIGREGSDSQMNAVIERNNKMERQAEEMKNKDRIGASGMYASLPMIVGVVKIMTDMILMIHVFTSSIFHVIQGG